MAGERKGAQSPGRALEQRKRSRKSRTDSRSVPRARRRETRSSLPVCREAEKRLLQDCADEMLAIGRGKTKPAQEALFFLDGWSFARDLLEKSGVLFPGDGSGSRRGSDQCSLRRHAPHDRRDHSRPHRRLCASHGGYASRIAGPKAARASAAALPGSSNDAVFLLAA